MLRRDLLMFVPAPLLTGRAALAADAAPGAAEAEPPILSVSGRIAPVPEGRRDFTLAQLEAIGTEELRTETPWTREAQLYSGVPLERLLAAVEATGQVLLCGAINRYRTEVPREDGWRNGALLATRLEGRPMRVRDRGPVWLLYPWTQRLDLRQAIFHERSIWQLRSIEVV